jgi:ketosteroid isomerase-like protein
MFRFAAVCVLVLGALLSTAGCAWWDDERAAVRQRLDTFKVLVNAPAPDGIGTVTRAAEISQYFTEDVTVDLGDGAAPITGREMLMAMAARLQPRLSEFRIDFADVGVQVSPDEQSAAVALTAEFIRRAAGSRQSMDAREFKLTMRQEDGEWRIARVIAVDTLK